MRVPNFSSMIDTAEALANVCKRCNNHYDNHWIIGIERRRICPITHLVDGMVMYRVGVGETEYEDS